MLYAKTIEIVFNICMLSCRDVIKDISQRYGIPLVELEKDLPTRNSFVNFVHNTCVNRAM